MPLGSKRKTPNRKLQYGCSLAPPRNLDSQVAFDKVYLICLQEKIGLRSRQYHESVKAARADPIPTMGNCAKVGQFSLQDLGDRAHEGVANLLPPPLGLDRLLEQNASARQLLEDFSAEAVLGFKTELTALMPQSVPLPKNARVWPPQYSHDSDRNACSEIISIGYSLMPLWQVLNATSVLVAQVSSRKKRRLCSVGCCPGPACVLCKSKLTQHRHTCLADFLCNLSTFS